MDAAAWGQLLALVAVIAITTPLLGSYLARVYGDGSAPGDRRVRPARTRHLPTCRRRRAARAAMDHLRPLGAGVQRGVHRVPVSAAAGARGLAAQPDRRGRGVTDDRVQHRRQLRDEHELAELQRRVDDERSDPDGRPRRAELRVRRGRHGCGDRLRARPGPAAIGHDRELLGGPHPHRDPGAAAPRLRRRDLSW